MRMRDQEVRLQRLGLIEPAAQLGDPGTRVDDDEVVVLVADLEAGGVAAIPQRFSPWCGPRAARAPKPDPHLGDVTSYTRLAMKTSSRSGSSLPSPASSLRMSSALTAGTARL